jgi:hypothetical protein
MLVSLVLGPTTKMLQAIKNRNAERFNIAFINRTLMHVKI